MGWLTDLDTAIQQRLTALQIGGKPALGTVGPLRATGRSPVPEEMLSADKPAMFYAVRRLAQSGHGVLAEVQALLIVENLRSEEAAWRGDGQASGAYALAEEAAKALAAADLAGTAGAWLRNQQLAHADGRVVAFTQNYEVLQSGQRVLIDGTELIGGRSIVQLAQSIGAAKWLYESSEEGGSPVASCEGLELQKIVFEGMLWAASETALQQIEQSLDTLLRDTNLHTLSTGSGYSWPETAMVSWQRTGARAAQPMLGLTGQAVRLEFQHYRQ